MNDLKADIVLIEEKLESRPNHEEIDQKFTKLHNYTPLKAFQGLQRIVSQKADGISQDE